MNSVAGDHGSSTTGSTRRCYDPAGSVHGINNNSITYSFAVRNYTTYSYAVTNNITVMPLVTTPHTVMPLVTTSHTVMQ